MTLSLGDFLTPELIAGFAALSLLALLPLAIEAPAPSGGAGVIRAPMAPALRPDLCVIGAGSGGLSVAGRGRSFGVPRGADREGRDGRRLPELRLRARPRR